MLLTATQHGVIHTLMNKRKCPQQAALQGSSHIPYKSLGQLCPPWSMALPPLILWSYWGSWRSCWRRSLSWYGEG